MSADIAEETRPSDSPAAARHVSCAPRSTSRQITPDSLVGTYWAAARMPIATRRRAAPALRRLGERSPLSRASYGLIRRHFPANAYGRGVYPSTARRQPAAVIAKRLRAWSGAPRSLAAVSSVINRPVPAASTATD
ncbi:hypothetical protein PsYK624_163770 [Phanerochaete sordida]|uniref:Uncharacterized protein n=1 Tax=Phanerochaete sordida TaxID=48140 RepID=A0A9P3GQS0_9APHY|nr:hypothetical protein PsYK624_163770 [Phanerochaete sordida]